jgi:hypothetical protein
MRDEGSVERFGSGYTGLGIAEYKWHYTINAWFAHQPKGGVYPTKSMGIQNVKGWPNARDTIIRNPLSSEETRVSLIKLCRIFTAGVFGIPQTPYHPKIGEQEVE